jgi:hypothetical protein
MPIESKYAVILAVVGFLVALWASGGSMYAAFGALALIAGAGWAVRRVARHRSRGTDDVG